MENKKQKEIKIIGILFGALSVLSFLEFKFLKYDVNFDLPTSILIFLIININLILLLLLIFMILRNLVKFYYERKSRVLGSKIKTRLLMAFILITLIPNFMLFISSANFINSSITYWFNAPVEQALKNSLKVGQNYFNYIEKTHAYFINENIKENQKVDIVKTKEKLEGSPFDFLEIYSDKGTRTKLIKTAEYQNADIEPFATISRLEKFPVTITQPMGNKRLIKTIIKQSDKFITLGLIADSSILKNMDRISEGYEEYQQIKLMRNSVKITYILALFVVSFLVIFSAIWFAFYFAKTLTDPIDELVQATQEVSSGNLDFKLTPVSNDEIGFLVTSFNKMTNDLQITKEELQKQNEEMEKRTRYIETILKNISTGVIALNSNGVVLAANPAFGNIFKTDNNSLIGKFYKKVLPEKYCEIFSKYINSGSLIVEEEVPLQLVIQKDPKNLLLKISSLHDENGISMGIVTACEDVTELEKAHRMAAWREVARQIAHEVKNPLTPISLAAQRLQRKYREIPDNEVFKECTQTIIDHVGIMRSLVNEFATYSRFPSPQKDLTDFNEVFSSIIPFYKEKYPDILFNTEISQEITKILMDKRQISQAIINLIDNAAAAMNNKGSINMKITYGDNKDFLKIIFSDSGPGIKESKKTRLFEPYFSTKKSGTGLGLTIVNSIINSHGGSIKIDENHSNGACFIIELPVA